MAFLSDLITSLGPSFIGSNCQFDSEPVSTRIELVYNQSLFSGDKTYIGKMSDQIINQMHFDFEAGALLLLSDVASKNETAKLPSGLRYAAFSCNQATLFNSLSQLNANTGHSSNNFAKCLEKLVDQKYQSSQELCRDFESLQYPINTFVRFAIVCKRNSDSVFSAESFATELEKYFPQKNIAVYNEKVVILAGHDKRAFEPFSKNDPKLKAFLKENDAFLMYSNATRNITTLKSLFTLTMKTLSLAIKLNKDPEANIFYYEDYCNYCILDMAIQTYLASNPNGDLIYLVHPAAIALTRYDKKYRSNLRDILYQYLVNDRNLVKTAEKTFLHRNTVINKMNKIKQIIVLDLDDAKFRQRMMFSIQFLKYYEDILALHIKD